MDQHADGFEGGGLNELFFFGEDMVEDALEVSAFGEGDVVGEVGLLCRLLALPAGRRDTLQLYSWPNNPALESRLLLSDSQLQTYS